MAILIRKQRERPTARDPGISALVEYFDEPQRFGNWEALNTREFEVVRTEAQRCRDDFTYAARNYFWIIDKKTKQEKLFTLWESQQLILQVMQDLRNKGKIQKVMILKARQLGCSTLLEALAAWVTIFFKNTNGLVVSYEPDHSAHLFDIMTSIYFRLPWWMQPMYSSMEFKHGIIFENPDRAARSQNPGMNSRLKVESANKMTGVGTGYRLDFLHGSEWCLWGSSTRSIIEGDFNNALADRPSTMAVLESTGDRAGSYAHSLWKKNVELGERAEWTPLFLPSFFESSRKYPLPAWWAQRGGPEKSEADMKVKIRSEWLQCSESACAAYGETIYGLIDQTDKECRSCGRGKMLPVEISDEYLYWMEVRRLNAEKDEESIKELRRQQAITAEDGWQTEGVQLFSQACRDWVQFTTKRPIFGGSIDNKGNFHGVLSTTGKCASEGCDLNHIGEETLTKVWQMPVEGAEYSIGVDVAEGLGGTADYSTVFVNRVRREGSGNDEQVALFRSNEIDPIGLAYVANALGRRYNDAMIAVELNRFDTCGSYLRLQLSYPNIYRLKLLDSTNILSTRMGWLTTVQSKPRLYTTAIRWLKANTWTIRSTNFLEEMGTFNKATDSRSVNAGEGFHDDELMAGMIALYCSHEADFDENLGFIPMTKKLTVENAPWVMSCNRCGQKTPGEVPRERSGCPYCGCMLVAWARNGTDGIAVADPASIILPPEYFDSLEDQKIRAIDYELI